MKRYLLPVLFQIFLFIFLIGCTTQRQLIPQVVREVQKDTIYLNKVQYDSIYIYQESHKDYHRGNIKLFETTEGMKLSETVDTLIIRDVSTQYRYKFLKDTVRIHQTDSIPVIKEVEVIKTERYTPWIYRTSLVIVIVIVIVLILYVLWKIKS